jgi:uncharacterized protein (TIGR02284 family)
MEDFMEKETKASVLLNDLIQVCRDANQGYWQAAGEVEDATLRKLFREKALERNDYACELQEVALRAGVKPEREGTFSGRVHRTWMNVRHHLNPHHDSVILLECKRGEEHALGVYQDVFENNLFPEIRQELEKQFTSMIEMRDLLGDRIEGKLPPEPTGSLLHLK